MRSLKTVVIGGGPSGTLASEKILGASAFNASVQMLEATDQIGGIPEQFPEVAPNSPFKDLYTFLLDLRTEGIFSEDVAREVGDLLETARDNPRLSSLGEAFRIVHSDLLEMDRRFSLDTGKKVTLIKEVADGRFQVHTENEYGGNSVYEAEAVVSAIGGIPKKNPYDGIFRDEISLEDALDPYSYTFEEKKVVILGASHSAAIAFVNAVDKGAKKIEVWHRGESFKEHVIDGKIKKFQFTGINDPTKSALREAMSRFNGKYVLKRVDAETPIKKEAYKDWEVVSAIGFERPRLEFESISGKRWELTDVAQSHQFGELAPNLLYPDTKRPIKRLYGLGLAYPQRFSGKDFLENSVEEPNAPIVGVYFTNELSRLMVKDLAESLSARGAK